MALLQINGVDLDTPSEYSVAVMDITQAERNAQGLMLIERIAQKAKINVKYNYCDGATLASILTKIDPIAFNITYLNPKTNTFRTSSFYVGDRSVGMIDYQSGVPRYKDLSFDFIER
jgi:hypothetical protein